jgi:glucose 1-dehydrogenase
MSDATESKPLRGQRAIVTGASSGIGAAIAQSLAAAGASVVVNYAHGGDGARSVATTIQRAGGHAVVAQADVSREEDAKRLIQTAVTELGSVDILVNNAGLQRDARLTDMTLDDWNAVIGVNLTGQFLCAREAVREFRRRGRVPALSSALGKIICISSVHDVIPWAGHANYAASKGGVSMLMKTMAQELAPDGIRVNAIAPGAIKTRINEAAWSTPKAEAALLRLVPYGRIGAPEEIGRAAVWLASDASDYVTGATLTIDGGMTLYPAFSHGG